MAFKSRKGFEHGSNVQMFDKDVLVVRCLQFDATKFYLYSGSFTSRCKLDCKLVPFV